MADRPRRPGPNHRALIAIALLIVFEADAAEPPPSVAAGRATTPIVLDGLLDEPAWAAAGFISDLTQQDPHPGGVTRYRTEVRLLEDGGNLYVGITCLDPEPEKIAVHTMQRDGGMDGDDTVAIVIDTFEDARTGYYFRVNAAGARLDGLISGSEGASLDWDGIWDARTKTTASGWSVEIAIPARTIRFTPGSGSWGFNVERYVARERIVFRWSGTTLDSSLYDLKRAGKLGGVSGMKQGAGLSLSPYTLGRREARFQPRGDTASGDTGLDITYNLTPGIAAVATINTDFAETEVDTRQINLTRFSLFFPEKRAFFLEGANQLDFGSGLDIGEDFIPFFSRRVGLFEGDQVPIRAGVKLLGRQGPVALGLLAVQTGGTQAAPSTNLFAGMVSLDATEHLRFGAIATSGDPSGLGSNSLGGLNAVWRTSTFLGNKNFGAGLWTAGTAGEPGAASAPPEFDRPGFPPFRPIAPPLDTRRSGWGFNVDYPNDLWNAYLAYSDFGGDLNPALGFLPRPGTRQYQVGQAYQPRPQEGWWASKVRQLYFETYLTYVEDLHGAPESWRLFAAPFNVTTQGGAHLEADWAPQFERLDAPFEISPGVVIPPGDYHFTRYRVEAETSRFRTWRVGTSTYVGEFFGGSLAQILAFASYTSSAGHIHLLLNTENDLGRLPEGDFVQRLLQLSAVYAFTPNLNVASYTQYDTETRNLGVNTRFRWTIRPGTDLFVVWNRGWQRPLPDPGDLTLAPSADEILVKLRHTWRP